MYRTRELETPISTFTTPAGYENLTREEILSRMGLVNQMIIARLGVSVTTNTDTTLVISENASVSSAENIERANEVMLNGDLETTAIKIQERLDPIINPSGFAEWLIRQIIRFQDSPFVWKLILASGLVITVIGGGYLAYRLVRRVSTPTLVTPFGVNTRLTTFGRVVGALMYKEK